MLLILIACLHKCFVTLDNIQPAYPACCLLQLRQLKIGLSASMSYFGRLCAAPADNIVLSAKHAGQATILK